MEMNDYLGKSQLKGKIKNHERVHLSVVLGNHLQSYEICLIVRCTLFKKIKIEMKLGTWLLKNTL